MLRNKGRAWRLAVAASLSTSLLIACTPAPPVVSADTSCAAFKRIDTTPEQDAAARTAPAVWYSHFLDVAVHNITFQKRCG